MSRVDAAQENPYQSSDASAINTTDEAAPKTQKLLTILGKLNVVFGIFGTFFSIVIGFGRAMSTSLEAAIQNAPSVPNARSFFAFKQGGCVVWGILSVGLLVAGIGLLKQKRFGRSLSIICAWLFMLLQVVEKVVAYVLVKVPELSTELQSMGGPQTAIQMVLADFGELLLALVYPIALLILLSRTSVIRALRD